MGSVLAAGPVLPIPGIDIPELFPDTAPFCVSTSLCAIYSLLLRNCCRISSNPIIVGVPNTPCAGWLTGTLLLKDVEAEACVGVRMLLGEIGSAAGFVAGTGPEEFAEGRIIR
jgi:hypothetical protein